MRFTQIRMFIHNLSIIRPCQLKLLIYELKRDGYLIFPHGRHSVTNQSNNENWIIHSKRHTGGIFLNSGALSLCS